MNEIPVKITTVCSNDTWPLIYLPKQAIEKLGLIKGTKVLLLIDENGRLVIEPIKVHRKSWSRARGKNKTPTVGEERD